MTGLRRGELLSLRWRYIDLGTGEVQVVESLERRRDKSLHFKVPKTEDSARPVILPASVIDALSTHRTQQIAYRTLPGLSGEPDLVFCEPDGTPWDPDRFSSAFAYQIASLGCPE